MRLTRSKYINLAIAMVIFAVIKLFLPLEYGLTAEGRSFIAVLLAMVYMWITVDMFVSSIIAMVLMGLTQPVSSASLFAGSFGSASLAILLFANLLIGAVGACGAIDKITKWFISRRIIAGHPFNFFLLFGTACFVLSAAISATYTILAVIPIAAAICESISYERGSEFFASTMLFAMWSCISGGIAFPFGKILYITLLGAMDGFGLTATFADVFVPALIVGVLWFFCGLAMVKFVLKPDVSGFSKYDPDEIRREMREHPLGTQGKILLAGFGLMIVLWILTSFSKQFAFAAFLNKIGYHIISAAIFAVLCVFPVDGKPVIDIKKTWASYNWSIFSFGAMLLFCTAGVSNSAFGIKEYLVAVLGPIFEGVPVMGIYVLGVLVAAIVTNFTSNNVTLAVVITAFVPMLTAAGVDAALLFKFCFACSFAAGMACATPAGCPAAALILDGHNATMKVSVLPNCIMVVIGAALSLGVMALF